MRWLASGGDLGNHVAGITVMTAEIIRRVPPLATYRADISRSAASGGDLGKASSDIIRSLAETFAVLHGDRVASRGISNSSICRIWKPRLGAESMGLWRSFENVPALSPGAISGGHAFR